MPHTNTTPVSPLSPPTASQAVCAAERVHKHLYGAKLYWLHSLVLVVLTGFGGGMVAPMMIGKPPLFYQVCIRAVPQTSPLRVCVHLCFVTSSIAKPPHPPHNCPLRTS